MEVTCGATWPTSSGGRREYRMTLDEDDLVEQLGGDAEAGAKVAAMNWQQKRKQLSIRSDMMVVVYMMEEGEYSQEHGMSRLKDLRAKLT